MFEQIVTELALEPYPRNCYGHYREVHRAQSSNESAKEARGASTHIYYALRNADRSFMHKVDADEMYHFYLGSPIVVVELDANESGHARSTVVGSDVTSGQRPFHAVKKGTWFGAYLLRDDTWALCGLTVSPAFVPEGFVAGKRKELLEEYPKAKEVILKLTESE
ncbi:uncharacterized protein [Oscarella lobularis]|uniref:uncharacterized protein n=1 Tax=Oscarella lobularis TaxID=121494 RepID=UPI003313C547